MIKKTFKRAFRDSLPVLAGYLALGVGFGVLLQSKGYSFWWAILMSCTMFAGSGQYAGVDFLASGASIITTAVMTFIINARHFFYGFSLLDKYKGAGWFKPYMIFGLTDETYSIVCSAQLDDTMDHKKYYLFLTALDHSYWITGCTLGALLGGILPFSNEGIGYSMTALFIVIMVEQWLTTKEHLPVILGVCTTIVCLVIFGADLFIIPAMAFIALELVIFRKKLDKTSAREEVDGGD